MTHGASYARVPTKTAKCPSDGLARQSESPDDRNPSGTSPLNSLMRPPTATPSPREHGEGSPDNKKDHDMTTASTPTTPATVAHDDEDHRYEDHGKIYFYFADGRWHLDATSVDGYPLDGLDGLDCTYGGCPNHCQTCQTPAATAEREKVHATPLPTGREVLDMLADWFGYSLIAKAEKN